MIPGVDEKYPTVLAPLAGWSDSAFRRLCKAFGVDMVYTEMVSADGARREQEKTLALAEFGESERPIAIQLFGAEPETVAAAVRIIAQRQPEFIDINFGCPARKVIKRGAGGALLRDLSLLQTIAEAAVKATNIPISAKLRLGWDGDSINIVQAAQRLQDVGVKMLAIHARTQSQHFKGWPDWSFIRMVKKAVTVPVIGNGDIKSAFDAKRMFDETGCDAVMVGRAACGNPWIFRQIKGFLDEHMEPEPPTCAERLNVCLQHFDLAVEIYGAAQAIRTMKKQIVLYVKGFPNASDLRKRILALDSCEKMRRVLLEQLAVFSQKVQTNSAKMI
ncbi:tRNA dihydrouridine synthase DusB [candidate division KSB1 bacterium]|nr:tRNA dihydrouridine synthase DusB [candidate division KSB1 bacterium]RQW06860.1 MAG: tRNA dihydrouridine synthase DusB [candidate division KSB1 bacterium]